MEDALPIRALVGVGAEVVALGLDQVGGETVAAQHVEVAEGIAHGEAGDAVADRGADHLSPAGLPLLDLCPEKLGAVPPRPHGRRPQR